MSDTKIDIAVVSDHPGIARWHAMAPPGRVAGVAGLRPIVPFRHDVLPPPAGPGVAELSLYVAPQWRRRGIGSRLLDAVRRRAAEGRAAERRVVVDVVAGSPGEAFSLRHGFRYARSRRHDLLTYHDVHQAWLSELVDAERPGYRLTHWTGAVLDSPGVRDLLRSPSRLGGAVLIAADAEGDLAAYAAAVAGAPWQPRARQYGPVVLPGHHGRHLDRWVSAALIQRLREVHPHVQEIETTTADDDADLLAVRAGLGFHLLRRTRLYELTQP
ncbi:GNAT family N-acetyltransferase [Dactylosporangium siamense]|uniref:N-acetyltransferase n=1 Tax=Dactylosporangium siamense TaxID=685454 RepID=A0A919PFT3_9ACTN|nr:GNAT family N-acetyltransferase [Dactylosporangium siamense]GIG43139.1 N-acetyltransferase [Dactylosporangium siamense]